MTIFNLKDLIVEQNDTGTDQSTIKSCIGWLVALNLSFRLDPLVRQWNSYKIRNLWKILLSVDNHLLDRLQLEVAKRWDKKMKYFFHFSIILVVDLRESSEIFIKLGTQVPSKIYISVKVPFLNAPRWNFHFLHATFSFFSTLSSPKLHLKFLKIQNIFSYWYILEGLALYTRKKKTLLQMTWKCDPPPTN